MAVSKRVRFEVLRRDNHACRYCGASAPDARLTIDHVVPVVLGGSDDPTNLVAACADCNAGKTSTFPDASTVENVKADATRWAAAMREVAAVRKQEREDRVELWGWFNMIWCEVVDPSTGDPHRVTPDWIDSVAQFLAAGLDELELEQLVRVTMRSQARDKWRYFCGCCHRRLRENTDLAARIIASQDGDDGA